MKDSTGERPAALRLVLAESALELVPKALQSSPDVKADARRRKRTPDALLLDASVHQTAMQSLPNRHRRGRPDLVHFFLLSVLGTPLNRAGRLEVVVHTRDDRILTFNPEVRLPRSQARFKGIVEGLLGRLQDAAKRGRAKVQSPFIRVEQNSLAPYCTGNGVSAAVLLSRTATGGPPFSELAREFVGAPPGRARGGGGSSEIPRAGGGEPRYLTVLVGGFQRGAITPDLLPSSVAVTRTALGSTPLDAWTVGARVVFLFEQALTRHRP